MADRLLLLLPELVLFAGAVLVAVAGLSPRREIRRALPGITAGFLLVAMAAVAFVHSGERAAVAAVLTPMPALTGWVRLATCGIAALLSLLTVGTIDRRLEADVQAGRLDFNPLMAGRGEFHAFFLLSIIGLLLCTSATDLIWLFVALELTSLPTYVMVAMSRPSRRAQEAAMKYFFLGALSAAIFLYGFALLYGATGTVIFSEMSAAFAAQRAGDGIPLVANVGLVLAIVGIGYKIAAVPMHFYAADVYEGAAAPVTAFLGYVPKAAGAVAMLIVLGAVGWEGGLPEPVLTTLWMSAVLTMTLGNIGALLQKSVKRMLAYSSIAHSGYLLIGIIAGPGLGITAVILYLVAYGVMNTGAFAVLASLERRGREIEDVEDLAGLRHRHPALAVALALCAGSLLGFPPLLGFVGKLYLFIAGVEAGQVLLVVIGAINSAISAWYYLILVGVPILGAPTARSETVDAVPSRWPRVAAVLAAVLVVLLPIVAARLAPRIDAGTAVRAAPDPASAAAARR